MPRAHRYFLPGHIWHITHRCHKKEFLLKFAKDRKRLRHWLFEAKKRYGLCILNYIVTSNHIHLLVQDRGKGEIARSMQLIAGRTAQEYNLRKSRKGAFWEDRYHATAVDSENYLSHCMAYIDLNMVRAGVVDHPAEWDTCGYNEIHNPPKRYAIIDRHKLASLLGFESDLKLRQEHAKWIDDMLKHEGLQRDNKWTENLAVGNQGFVEAIKSELGVRGLYRNIVNSNDAHLLKEQMTSYMTNSE